MSSIHTADHDVDQDYAYGVLDDAIGAYEGVSLNLCISSNASTALWRRKIQVGDCFVVVRPTVWYSLVLRPDLLVVTTALR